MISLHPHTFRRGTRLLPAISQRRQGRLEFARGRGCQAWPVGTQGACEARVLGERCLSVLRGGGTHGHDPAGFLCEPRIAGVSWANRTCGHASAARDSLRKARLQPATAPRGQGRFRALCVKGPGHRGKRRRARRERPSDTARPPAACHLLLAPTREVLHGFPEGLFLGHVCVLTSASLSRVTPRAFPYV